MISRFELEKQLDRTAVIFIYHSDKEERKKAWEEFKRLHKLRSAEKVKEMEREIFK